MPHFMIVIISYIYLVNLSWIKKYLFLRNIEHLHVNNVKRDVIYQIMMIMMIMLMIMMIMMMMMTR